MYFGVSLFLDNRTLSFLNHTTGLPLRLGSPWDSGRLAFASSAPPTTPGRPLTAWFKHRRPQAVAFVRGRCYCAGLCAGVAIATITAPVLHAGFFLFQIKSCHTSCHILTRFLKIVTVELKSS